jgi:hypothetical protein
MKTKRLLLNSLFAILAVGFAACQGDQGEIGPKGDTGSTGNTGANGTGFDELTQYGNIEVTFSGTRSDEVAFTETVNFLYMPGSGVADNSSFYEYSDTDREFFIGRENKGPAVKTGRTNGADSKNDVWLRLRKNSDGLFMNQLDFYTDILTSDFKTFEIYYSTQWEEGFDIAVTDYSYDAATGKLKFNFTYTIPDYNNGTGNDITVTGKADVTVFERIDLPS